MKIYGDIDTTKFTNFTQEPGLLFGNNDVLKGEAIKTYSIGPFRSRVEESSYEPKLFLHIPTNMWSSFTGLLREYLLPWRWQVAHIDQIAPSQILVNISDAENHASSKLKRVLGKPLFEAHLIKQNRYDEIFGSEFIRVKTTSEKRVIEIRRPLMGFYKEFTSDNLCHIYRPRSLFSLIKYYLLRQFSSTWKEVAIEVKGISKNILIKKTDEASIKSIGLIVKN